MPAEVTSVAAPSTRTAERPGPETGGELEDRTPPGEPLGHFPGAELDLLNRWARQIPIRPERSVLTGT